MTKGIGKREHYKHGGVTEGYKKQTQSEFKVDSPVKTPVTLFRPNSIVTSAFDGKWDALAHEHVYKARYMLTPPPKYVYVTCCGACQTMRFWQYKGDMRTGGLDKVRFEDWLETSVHNRRSSLHNKC